MLLKLSFIHYYSYHNIHTLLNFSLFYFFTGVPNMMWLKLARSTRWICRHDNLVMLRPHIRSLSHGSFNLDIRIQTNQPFCPRSHLLTNHPSHTLALGLQHRRTVATDRPGWYESIAESTPVCLTEQLLVSTQQITGLPWWASIICTTLALRTAITLPLGIYQTIIIAKVVSGVVVM